MPAAVYKGRAGAHPYLVVSGCPPSLTPRGCRDTPLPGAWGCPLRFPCPVKGEHGSSPAGGTRSRVLRVSPLSPPHEKRAWGAWYSPAGGLECPPILPL